MAIIINLDVMMAKWNIKFPIITMQLNDYIYKFNTKYFEVKRLNEIISSYMGKEFFRETLKKSSVPLYKNAKESLYNINLTVPKSTNRDSIVGNPPIEVWMLTDFQPDDLTRERTNIYLSGVRYGVIYYFTYFYIGISLMAVLITCCILLIIFNTRKIFLTISDYSVFTKENAIRIKYIAVYILLIEFIRLLVSWWFKYSFDKAAIFDRYYSLISWTDINYWLFFVGAILLLISAILQSGSSIKEENDLTV
ncbi:MAG: DUF2975 domain-containing protein [Ignavibacteriales bacterium]|nr:MAG: DUF2975 domain-containing protein [Ignavibacteriales bacterium]